MSAYQASAILSLTLFAATAISGEMGAGPLPVQASPQTASPLSVRQPVSFEAVQLTLDQTSQSQRIHIVDFGDIASGQQYVAKLTVTNLLSTTLSLDAFQFGGYVQARWAKPSGLVRTHVELPAHGSAELDVTLRCADLSKQPIEVVGLFHESAPVTTIVAAYLAHPASLAPPPIVTPPLQSGKGTAFSVWYQLQAGPSPYGYKLASQRFEAAGSDPDGNSRDCAHWMKCQLVRADDTNVVWSFAIQGFEHDWTHSDSTVQAVGFLTVTYTLKTSPPVLKSIER